MKGASLSQLEDTGVSSQVSEDRGTAFKLNLIREKGKRRDGS